MCRYVSQSSQMTLGLHRAKNGLRNHDFLAKGVVANVVLEARDLEVKGDKSVYLYSGTPYLLNASSLN